MCNCRLGDVETVRKCVHKALDQELPPVVPEAYSQRAYHRRIRAIFEPILDAQA